MERLFGVRATYNKVTRRWQTYPLTEGGAIHPLAREALKNASSPAMVLDRLNGLVKEGFEVGQKVVSRETIPAKPV